MVVGVGIINAHVFEEPFDVIIEETLNLSVIEFGVDKQGTNVRLHDIRKSLKSQLLGEKRPIGKSNLGTFGAVFVKVQ